ncbi:hypothetical protein TNCV_4114151 [Trichonephila clavipes]|nr:hypothetical protein TNCV_4114151 [Trichonephila clavipes]
MLGLTRLGCRKTVSALLLHFLGLPIPRFVSNRVYLGSYETASWASHGFERTSGKLQLIWNEMSQDIIQSLYVSMPDPIASSIRARRGSTGY